jgi:hypothetical protein
MWIIQNFTSIFNHLQLYKWKNKKQNFVTLSNKRNLANFTRYTSIRKIFAKK